MWQVTSRERQNKMFKFDVMSLEVGCCGVFFLPFLNTFETAVSSTCCSVLCVVVTALDWTTVLFCGYVRAQSRTGFPAVKSICI